MSRIHRNTIKLRSRKRRTRSRRRVSHGGNRESILFIIVNNTLDSEFTESMKELSKYIAHLSTKYTVDVAGISGDNNFSNYSGIIDFKFTHVNTKGQLSKMCDFITQYKGELNYDWFVKFRPGVKILDYNTINFDALPKDAINARAREYRGKKQNKNACSVGGVGIYTHIKNCIHNNTLSSNNQDKATILDDLLYIFHKNVIDKGGFLPIEGGAKEDEYFHANIWKGRNIKLNAIPLDIKFTTNKYPIETYSGNIV